MDALLPHEMAEKAEATGVRKAALPFLSLFALSILAGAFIGLGAMFATTTAAATSSLPYGVARLLIGLGILPGLDLGRCRWSGIVHREQPDRHGLGQP